jgi:hypothetical protein
MKKRWMSNYDECDICHGPIKNKVDFFVDGQIKGSSCWALMCPQCFKKYGVGIKYGIGQKYDGHTGLLLEGGSDLNEE